MQLGWLAAEVARQREGQLRTEIEERRHFEAMGLDYGAVQRARAAAYTEAVTRAMQEHRQPYQMEIPGINATLMSLRSREPVTADEARAMGVVLPSEQVSRSPAGEQMELGLGVPAAANQVRPLLRLTTKEPASGHVDWLPRLKGNKRATKKTMRSLPAGNARMAGDPAVQAMALSILLGQTVPGAYGLYDAATGEVNYSNSGELAMNSYLAGLPLMGLIGGATGVAVADPAARAALGGIHMSSVKAKKGQSPTTEEVASFMRDANAAAGREMKRNPGMSKQEAVALAGQRGRRNLVGGGLAGTLVGGIPAMMLMQDPSQSQGG